MPDQLWTTIISQGGAVVIAVVMGWAYRRDMQRIIAKDEEKIQVLTSLVQESARAIQAATSQSMATEKALGRLSRVLEEGGRRAYDPISRKMAYAFTQKDRPPSESEEEENQEEVKEVKRLQLGRRAGERGERVGNA